MSKSESNKNSGKIPEHVLHQMFEHTIGGFICFYFNQETGEPEQVMLFDSPAHSLALQKYIADWMEAIHKINLDSSVNSITSQIQEVNQDNDENDEDE